MLLATWTINLVYLNFVLHPLQVSNSMVTICRTSPDIDRRLSINFVVCSQRLFFLGCLTDVVPAHS
jgi:hypothetical protein